MMQFFGVPSFEGLFIEGHNAEPDKAEEIKRMRSPARKNWAGHFKEPREGARGFDYLLSKTVFFNSLLSLAASIIRMTARPSSAVTGSLPPLRILAASSW